MTGWHREVTITPQLWSSTVIAALVIWLIVMVFTYLLTGPTWYPEVACGVLAGGLATYAIWIRNEFEKQY